MTHQDSLGQAVSAIRAGRNAEARRLLARILEAYAGDEDAGR